MKMTRRTFLKTMCTVTTVALFPDITKANREVSLNIPVLLYHEIRENKDDYSISPSQFASHMEWLYQNGYKTLIFNELDGIIRGGRSDNKYVIITFDDGSVTFMEHAFPLLSEYGFKAVMNIIGKRTLKDRSVISIDELREPVDSGMVEIGCHTFELHTPLTECTETAIKNDIEKFREHIDKTFGIKTEVFAFPYGKYDKKTVRIIRELGFSYILTSDEGFLKDIRQPVPRLNINWRLDLTSFREYIGGEG